MGRDKTTEAIGDRADIFYPMRLSIRSIGFIVGLPLMACGDSSGTAGGGEDAAGGHGAGVSDGGGSTGGGSANGGGDVGGGGTGAGPATAACAASTLEAPSTDCAAENVRCVDGSGAEAEYPTIQEAADASQPGDTIVVKPGGYAGFEIDTSGTDQAPIVYYADGEVTIDSPAPTGDGIRLENVSHVRVIGFSVHDTEQRCIAARGATPDEPMVDDWIVGNTCERAGVEGIYVSELSSSHVELNVITDSGASGDTRSHGIYLANAGSDGTTICGNVISGASPEESNGIHFNGDLSVGGDGIISGLTVEGNIIFGNAQNGLNMDGVQDSVIRNNLIYGNARNALRAYAIDAAEGPKNLTIVNNTFLTTETGGWPVKLTEDLGGHVVFNCILLSDNPDTGSIALAPSPDFASAHNVVVDRFTNDDEDSIVSLAEWQGLGYDDGSVVGSPAALFYDPSQSDYHLLGTASAVGLGLDAFEGQSAPATDLEGNARPPGAVDAGAYEAP